ncbi:MAG TPA: hypothetical protein VIO61_10020 [Anaerolineaceae bacterium]
MKNMSWQTKTFLLGGLVGAGLGLLAAFLLVKQAEQNQTTPKLSAGEGVKIGLGILGVLKLITDGKTAK